jgi:hypothetical protein
MAIRWNISLNTLSDNAIDKLIDNFLSELISISTSAHPGDKEKKKYAKFIQSLRMLNLPRNLSVLHKGYICGICYKDKLICGCEMCVEEPEIFDTGFTHNLRAESLGGKMICFECLLKVSPYKTSKSNLE